MISLFKEKKTYLTEIQRRGNTWMYSPAGHLALDLLTSCFLCQHWQRFMSILLVDNSSTGFLLVKHFFGCLQRINENIEDEWMRQNQKILLEDVIGYNKKKKNNFIRKRVLNRNPYFFLLPDVRMFIR